MDASTVGGVVHLVHQGLMKITLFFCAGNLDATLGIKKISQMHGVGRRMPWTMAAFTAGAMGMIGVPPLCGFISKWYLGSGAIEASQYWVLVVLAVAWIACCFGSRRESPMLPSIPAGDMLAAWRPMQACAARCLHCLIRGPQGLYLSYSPVLGRASRIFDGGYFRQIIRSAESVMQRWSWIAMLLVILIVVFWTRWFYSS